MASNSASARNVLENILKTEVQLEGAEENVKILKNVLDVLIEKMKGVDPLFKKVFNRIFYTGSYFEGLRVKEATEFDLNLVLVFPFKKNDFEVSTNCSVPSFAKFHLTTRLEDLVARNEWKEIRCALDFFTEGFLMSNKIRQWFQGVIDKVKNNLPKIQGVSQIVVSNSGPARTLLITRTNKIQLDVDLVPVLEFKPPEWPLNAKKQFGKHKISDKDKYWFLIPKPAPDELAARKEKTERLWRLHFPGIERSLLYNNGCVKPVIKLMKLLRDRQNWPCLASYYLKTVVMWAVVDNKPETLEWNIAYLDKIFLLMLKKLRSYVEQKKLPYLFYPQYNLLYKLTENQSLAQSIHGHLTRTIRNIESNPAYYNTILIKKIPALTSETCEQTPTENGFTCMVL